MQVYDYILKDDRICEYDNLRKNSARYIVETDLVEEFILPKQFAQGIFTKKAAQRYFKSQLKKESKDYYLLPTKFDFGIHCIFLDKSRLNEVIDEIKHLDFSWVSPYYFAMEIIDERKYESGKLYINIGKYIYKLELEKGAIVSYHSHMRESYYSKDMKKIDFFKKSIVWVEDEDNGFAKKSQID